jgi:hypothetical protein
VYQAEIKGVANVEKVLLETADSVTEVKRKLEFGIQQIIFKVKQLLTTQTLVIANAHKVHCVSVVFDVQAWSFLPYSYFLILGLLNLLRETF